MRFQSLVRLIAIGSITITGVMSLSINHDARSAQSGRGHRHTPSASTPITGVPLTYTVKSGDSFNAIARQFNLTPQRLQTLNTISDTNVICVGQVLIVGITDFTATPTPPRTSAPTSTANFTATPTATPWPTARPTVEQTATLQPSTTLPPKWTRHTNTSADPQLAQPANSTNAHVGRTAHVSIVWKTCPST